MTERTLDELGPVDYLIVEFPPGHQNFKGEIADELVKLHDSGTVRVMDVVIIVKNADGSVGAIADGVSLRLLKGINGGINLDLAHAEAGVAGSPAVADIVDIPRAAELPRTGGSGPWLPVAGATLIAAAVVTRRFVLRTR